jgi:hypothetical protein
MLEGLALFALASTAVTAPAMQRKEESLVVIRREQSASIEQSVENALNKFLSGTATTYQTNPLLVRGEDIPFVSPVISSFTVKAKLRVGGEVIQPPIDFDDLIYFDE